MSSFPANSRQAVFARRLRARPPRRPGLRLRADEVDVWRTSLDQMALEAADFLASLLSEDELARAQRFYFERDRRRAIASRGTLRLLLSRYVGRSARELRFVYGANGKPALVRERGEPEIQFNVAHAEELALYALTATGGVGVDVERVREVPEWESIAASSFTADVAEAIRQARNERRSVKFLHAWTRQEAMLKALGVGLGGETPAVADHALRLHSVDAGRGFVGALAVDATVRWANCRVWRAEDARRDRNFFRSTRRAWLESAAQTPISFP